MLGIKKISTVITAILVFVIFGTTLALAEPTVLCTTFPIYQITRNVTQADKDLKVQLMLPSQMGCPHGYTLSPQDMKKIAQADILVINGLGMEEFLGAPIQKANPKIQIIDSSNGIGPTIPYAPEKGHLHEHEHSHDHDHKTCNHHHTGTNPHLFASPRMTAQIAVNIAAGLSRISPDKANIYFQQAVTYAKAMDQLADDAAAVGKGLKNKRIIQPHGAFDYFARDMGLHIIETMQPHGQAPSAAEMVNLVRRINKRKVGAIFTEPQYSQDAGQTLSKETGVPVIIIDPAATGPEQAPLTYYETTMRQNLKVIEQTLGTE